MNDRFENTLVSETRHQLYTKLSHRTRHIRLDSVSEQLSQELLVHVTRTRMKQYLKTMLSELRVQFEVLRIGRKRIGYVLRDVKAISIRNKNTKLRIIFTYSFILLRRIQHTSRFLRQKINEKLSIVVVNHNLNIVIARLE